MTDVEKFDKAIKENPEKVLLIGEYFLKVMYADNGITPTEFNSSINLISANKHNEYKCSQEVLEIMLRMQKQYSKLLNIYYGNYEKIEGLK